MEVSATLTDLILTTAGRGLGVVISLADRGDYTGGDITLEQVKGIVDVLSGGALSIRETGPIPCVARFHNGRLVALRHATEQRWVIFEDLPEPRAIRSVADMVQG